jgi:hypothetical protein
MERRTVERRTVLKGGAAVVGLLGGASSELSIGDDQALADTPASGLPQQIQAAVERFRATIPPISITIMSKRLSSRFFSRAFTGISDRYCR